MGLIKRWRLWTGVGLFIVSELLLCAAAEGLEKWTSIFYASIPNVFLTIGFIVPGRRAYPKRTDDDGTPLGH
jgi:hypothetical protein